MSTRLGILLVLGLALAGLVLHYTDTLPILIEPLLFLSLGTLLGYLIASEREKDRRREESDQEAEEENQRSVHDALTQAYSRRHMDKVLAQFWEMAGTGGASFSLLLVDIDNFRSVNTRFGNEVGDRVLQTVAHNLQDNTRKTDMVFRFAEDRFLLLLPMTRGEVALTLANRLREEFFKLTFRGLARETFKVDFSVGVMEYRGDLTGLDEMLRRVEGALMRAKKENSRTSLAS